MLKLVASGEAIQQQVATIGEYRWVYWTGYSAVITAVTATAGITEATEITVTGTATGGLHRVAMEGSAAQVAIRSMLQERSFASSVACRSCLLRACNAIQPRRRVQSSVIGVGPLSVDFEAC